MREQRKAWAKPSGYVPRPLVYDARTDRINAEAQLAAKADAMTRRERGGAPWGYQTRRLV